jgi:hypothetical protein
MIATIRAMKIYPYGLRIKFFNPSQMTTGTD